MRITALIWRAAGLLLATGVDSVVEVLPPLACTRAPATPEWVRGLFCYRGQLIPLIDVSCLLGSPATPDRRMNRVLVVRGEQSSGHFDSPVGLWVESVLELERIDFDQDGRHPGFATERGRFLGPVVQTGAGQVQLVDPSELFTAEQAAVITQRLKEATA